MITSIEKIERLFMEWKIEYDMEFIWEWELEDFKIENHPIPVYGIYVNEFT